jgi:hypothetical protein
VRKLTKALRPTVYGFFGVKVNTKVGNAAFRALIFARNAVDAEGTFTDAALLEGNPEAAIKHRPLEGGAGKPSGIINVTMADADQMNLAHLTALLAEAGFARVVAVTSSCKADMMLMVPAELPLGEPLYHLHQMGACEIAFLGARDRKVMPMAYRGDNRDKEKPFFNMIAFYIGREETLLEYEATSEKGAKWVVEDKVTLELTVQVGSTACAVVSFETAAALREFYVSGATPDQMDKGGDVMAVMAAILGLPEDDLFATSQAYNIMPGTYLVRFPKSAGSLGRAQMDVICDLEAYSTAHGFTPLEAWEEVLGGAARNQPALLFSQTEMAITESIRQWVSGAERILEDQREKRKAGLAQEKTAAEVSAVGAMFTKVNLAQIAMATTLESQRLENERGMAEMQEESKHRLDKHGVELEAVRANEEAWRDAFGASVDKATKVATDDRRFLGQGMLAQMAISNNLGLNLQTAVSAINLIANVGNAGEPLAIKMIEQPAAAPEVVAKINAFATAEEAAPLAEPRSAPLPEADASEDDTDDSDEGDIDEIECEVDPAAAVTKTGAVARAVADAKAASSPNPNPKPNPKPDAAMLRSATRAAEATRKAASTPAAAPALPPGLGAVAGKAAAVSAVAAAAEAAAGAARAAAEAAAKAIAAADAEEADAYEAMLRQREAEAASDGKDGNAGGSNMADPGAPHEGETGLLSALTSAEVAMQMVAGLKKSKAEGKTKAPTPKVKGGIAKCAVPQAAPDAFAAPPSRSISPAPLLSLSTTSPEMLASISPASCARVHAQVREHEGGSRQTTHDVSDATTRQPEWQRVESDEVVVVSMGSGGAAVTESHLSPRQVKAARDSDLGGSARSLVSGKEACGRDAAAAAGDGKQRRFRDRRFQKPITAHLLRHPPPTPRPLQPRPPARLRQRRSWQSEAAGEEGCGSAAGAEQAERPTQRRSRPRRR